MPLAPLFFYGCVIKIIETSLARIPEVEHSGITLTILRAWCISVPASKGQLRLFHFFSVHFFLKDSVYLHFFVGFSGLMTTNPGKNQLFPKIIGQFLCQPIFFWEVHDTHLPWSKNPSGMQITNGMACPNRPRLG